MGDDKRFLTVEEFTERLNALGLPFSVRTIRLWVAKGKIKAIRPGARAWYIPVEEVDRICRSGVKGWPYGLQQLDRAQAVGVEEKHPERLDHVSGLHNAL